MAFSEVWSRVRFARVFTTVSMVHIRCMRYLVFIDCNETEARRRRCYWIEISFVARGQGTPGDSQAYVRAVLYSACSHCRHHSCCLRHLFGARDGVWIITWMGMLRLLSSLLAPFAALYSPCPSSLKSECFLRLAASSSSDSKADRRTYASTSNGEIANRIFPPLMAYSTGVHSSSFAILRCYSYSLNLRNGMKCSAMQCDVE
mmetsp:Transcript_7190/g.19486  ORF Transcript_7190/g.19486 Transcript_7190/m.19486 type:complete len:203 (+) Transcript_7190:131-739(+)